jgi:hypothetical protein
MPLTPAQPREHLHTRQVECRGYRRTDGLWDIEGHITDVKTYAFDNDYRGQIEPGTPIHDMWMRLTLDDSLTIRDIEVVTDASPFAICTGVLPNYRKLIGLSIRPGFTRKTRVLLGGVHGCTHLTELLGPVATTAFQTIFPVLAREREDMAAVSGSATSGASDRQGRPALLNTCHAFSSEGSLVKQRWPEFYTGES